MTKNITIGDTVTIDGHRLDPNDIASEIDVNEVFDDLHEVTLTLFTDTVTIEDNLPSDCVLTQRKGVQGPTLINSKKLEGIGLLRLTLGDSEIATAPVVPTVDLLGPDSDGEWHARVQLIPAIASILRGMANEIDAMEDSTAPGDEQ